MSNARHQWTEVLRLALKKGEISRHPRLKDLVEVAKDAGWSGVPLWFRQDSCRFKTGRGEYDLSSLAGSGTITVNPDLLPPPVVTVAPATAATPAPATPAPTAILQQSLLSSESVVPAVDPDFIPWGHFNDVTAIVKSGMFYPVFVTGLSGNGKTTMIQQACAKVGRECYRVNITSQTDEDDLLGGFRLVNGETVWYDGPVIQAMKSGAILLLDEVDLGSSPLMCLQPVLEGRGIFLKKINQFVQPAAGFTVFATANTKGKGDDTGSFAHTGILNEAFLDRFPVTLEQEYPTNGTEKRIITKKMNTLGTVDDDFAGNLVKWADAIRKTYLEGGVSEIITTRRLLSIVQAWNIFGDKSKAIAMAISRFDAETKADFLRLYTKIDGDPSLTAEPTPSDSEQECPF